MQDPARFDRREFPRLAGFGGGVFASGLAGCAARPAEARDVHFVQLSDSHGGFEGPIIISDLVVRVPFTADRGGRFDFVCDVFCGDAREGMQGHLLVS
jgi:hypothetical protein